MNRYMPSTNRILSVFILSFLYIASYGQQDTIVLKPGNNVLTGSFESLSGDAVYFKTAYTADNIPLKRDSVFFLKTYRQYKIVDRKIKIFIGKVYIDSSAKDKFRIVRDKDTLYLVRKEVTDIEEYKSKRFRDHFRLSADIGFTTTKANNSQQVSIGLKMGYTTNRWDLSMDYYSFAAAVDTNINSRGSLTLAAKYLIQGNWFFLTQANTFTNTEQQLDDRFTYYLGAGKFVIKERKNNLYFFAGANYNREKFANVEPAFESAEAFGGGHIEYEVLKHLKLLSEVFLYPSLTEAGRLRSYFKADVGYSFAKHFTVGVNYTLNTDNKPPVNSTNTDYIFNFKFGWSLN